MDDLAATKTCARCRQPKPLDEFPLRRKDGTKRYGHCRDCKAAYQRQWYERNGERHRANAARNRAKQRKKNMAAVRRAKSVPCTDCGVRYPPYVMDFDHVRGTKVANVSLLKTYATTAMLLAEIAKCDVVCSNCHRIRSHRRARAANKHERTQRHRSVQTERPSGPQQMQLRWVAGGSNSEPWA